MNIDIGSDGRIYVRNQVDDYYYRGKELDEYSVLDFFVDTYEDVLDPEDMDESLEDTDRVPGRPKTSYALYHPSHLKSNERLRKIRQRGHRNLPNFVGRYFPRRDDSNIQDFYCASILTLLKPWRSILTDLKSQNQTWTQALDSFLIDSPRRKSFVVSGIQLFHESKPSSMDNTFGDEDQDRTYRNDDDEMYLAPNDVHAEEEINFENELNLTEEDIDNLYAAQIPIREELHGRTAIEYAKSAKIFPEHQMTWNLNEATGERRATGGDIQLLDRWKTQMQRDVTLVNDDQRFPGEEIPTESANGVEILDSTERTTTIENRESEVTVLSPEEPLSSASVQELNDDQYRAYNIITQHLQETLSGRDPPPLKMIICGEGGTGKSRVIQTVTEAFRKASKFDHQRFTN